MSDITVNRILEWETIDGDKKCFMVVIDDEEHGNSNDKMWLEVCHWNKETDRWEEEEKFENVHDILSFGIPESCID